MFEDSSDDTSGKKEAMKPTLLIIMRLHLNDRLNERHMIKGELLASVPSVRKQRVNGGIKYIEMTNEVPIFQTVRSFLYELFLAKMIITMKKCNFYERICNNKEKRAQILKYFYRKCKYVLTFIHIRCKIIVCSCCQL